MIRLLLIVGLLLSIAFSAIQWWLAEPNWVLSGISSMVLFITVLGFVVTLFDDKEPPQFKWALLYTFPMALLVLSSVARNDNLLQSKLAEHQVSFVVPQVLPGTRQDYIDALWSHFASLSIPAMTVVAGLLIAWGTQWWSSREARDSS